MNESLLLTKDEENRVNQLMEMAWEEFNNGKDNFSIPIILSYISTLLNLTERFYDRQFITRKKLCKQLSSNFYRLLKNFYRGQPESGIKQPTVKHFASQLNVTPNYLSDTIRHDSGESALTTIHAFVLEEAKKN